MTAPEIGRPHPHCWKGDHYEHDCHELSGKRCFECGAPAGTPWGPYWCPDCDVKRLARIDEQLLSLAADPIDDYYRRTS